VKDLEIPTSYTDKEASTQMLL